MAGTGDWLYAHREKISYGAAIVVTILAVLPRPALQHQPFRPSTEIMAMLEDAPRPKADEPKAPQPVMPKPVAQISRPKIPNPEHRVVEARPAVASPAAIHETPAPMQKPAVPAPVTAPPPPPKPVVQEPPRDAATSAHYEQLVLAALERSKHYPTSREARLTHPDGTVKVWLELDRNGQLLGTGLLESSGSNLLDSAALHTVRLTQFQPFPAQAYPGETTHRFIAHLNYQINSGQ